MNAAVRRVRLVRIGMMLSVVLYAVVGQEIGHPAQAAPDSTFYFAIALLTLVNVALVLATRRWLVVPAEAVLARQPDDRVAMGRWQMGYIVTYALSEAVALFGLVLRLQGFPLAQVAIFYAVGLILMMFFAPHPPSGEME
jgi:hypothetical protein